VGALAYRAEVRLAEDAGATTLTFDLQVRTPGGPLGRLAERLLLAGRIERDTRDELARLKAIVEREPAP
jgi:uncharacterized membrane protein